MLKQIKIGSTDGTGKTLEFYVDGKVFPVTDVQFSSNVGNGGLNKVIVGTIVKEFEFNGQAELILNGHLIGSENEKRLYKQLKRKYGNNRRKNLVKFKNEINNAL